MDNINSYIEEFGKEPELDELMAYISHKNRHGGETKKEYFTAKNANVTPEQQRQIDLATEQFKQAVGRVENQILAQYIQAIQEGDYAKAEKILENAQESQQANTLMFALLTIATILSAVYVAQRVIWLFSHFNLVPTPIFVTDEMKLGFRHQALRGAQSHVQTIAKDLKALLDEAIIDAIKTTSVADQLRAQFGELEGLEGKELTTKVIQDQEMFKFARDLVLKGESKDTVIAQLQSNFENIAQRRANLIASNEANRVFTMSQYEADQQFVAQNGLEGKAYKRLVSNTGHPEAICKAIIDKTAKDPIPLKQDFIPFGKTFTVKSEGKTYKIKPTYERLRSGHIHVNCHCRYELLIKQEDGTFKNTFDGTVLNSVDFDESKHKRDKDGKFAKKAGGSSIDLSDISDVKSFDKYVEDAYWEGSHGHYHDDVADSVRAYQGHYYDAINIHARANQLEDEVTVYGEKTTYGELIDNIDRAGNITLTKDTTLYRGTEIPVHQNVDVGEEIYSRSFLSTSVSKKVAEDFKYEGGSMLVITAKKGQKVIIPDLVTFGKRGKTMGEAEVLGMSNSTLKVTKIEGDTVYAELN